MNDITVIIPTSPIKRHPSITMIQATIAMVRYQLPFSKIIIACDGVREEQQDRVDDYAKYKGELYKWITNTTKIDLIDMVIFDEQIHQTGMIKKILPTIETNNLLFIEHDFPIVGYIPWEGIVNILNEKKVDLIRFYLEPRLIPEHKHLFLDEEPINIGGVPLIRIGQWSQRPHVARIEFYKKIIEELVPDDANTFIEDAIHGYFDSNFVAQGERAWKRNRLTIYYPAEDISRCYHLDGREDDPKWV